MGKDGQIGHELAGRFGSVAKMIAPDRRHFDLAKPQQIRDFIRGTRPDVIINAAAYTAVEKAEEEPVEAMKINGTAPGILAEEAKRGRALLVHYSTDYVFDGRKNDAYDERDEPNPLNVYGLTKREGERAIQAVGPDFVILRTSWVYGWRRNNFLKTILRLAKERKEIGVVDDQVGIPTWCRDIAVATVQVMTRADWRGRREIFHLASQGETTWYGFARRIIEWSSTHSGFEPTSVRPLSTDGYPTKAVRPRNSRLDSRKIQRSLGIQIGSWETSLSQVLIEGLRLSDGIL